MDITIEKGIIGEHPKNSERNAYPRKVEVSVVLKNEEDRKRFLGLLMGHFRLGEYDPHPVFKG